MKTVGEFEVAAGETVPFVLTYALSHVPPPRSIPSIRVGGDGELLEQLVEEVPARRTLLGPVAAH